MRAVNIELIISVGVTCKLNSRHSIPGKGEDSLLRHHTQSGSWPQWGSYSLLTAGSLCGCVQLASHLGVTNAWNCNSTPPHVPAPGSGVYEHRGNNILTTVTTGFPACQPSFFFLKLFPEYTRYVPPCATVCSPYTYESTVALGLRFLHGPFLLRMRTLLQFFKPRDQISRNFALTL
jgi:hypothetical protein